MKYIDLFIQKVEKDTNSKNSRAKYNLSEIIQGHQVTIVLGSPGSGKTSILEKYKQDNPHNTQLLTIRRFLQTHFSVDENIKYLLLDGLDEFKSVTSDKSSVIDDVGYKIKTLTNINAVITCRQADWFGNSDTNALSSILNNNVQVYNLSKLDSSKKGELAMLYGIVDSYEFINKFDEYGFLENPQMFKMIAELYLSDTNEKINSKSDLYRHFITNAIEKNEFYLNNQINELEKEELLKGIGYISIFNIFSGIEVFDEEVLTNIVSSDNGFSKTTLRKVLNTNLFDAKRFIHRTIAEYAAANYLSQYKFVSTDGVQFERLKSLFTVNEKVPTVLRGTFLWLCSLTKDKTLVAIDPYNLLKNGDCDSFPPSLKIELLKSIKNLSQINPNFVRGGDYYGFNPTDFYQPDLDDYLLSIIRNILTINSEYEFLIYKIIQSSKNLSNRILKVLKSQFLDTTVENPIRYRLIKVFQKESPLLLKVLNKIKDGSIKNDEGVIDKLLDCLYPETITHLQIVDYLLLYETFVIGHLRFLDKTKYNDKKALVGLIFKEIFRNDEINSKLAKMVNYFINDYLVETILEYEKSLTAKEIYQIVSQLRAHDNFESFIELKFKFESFKPNLNLTSETNQAKISKLSNELFDIFVTDTLNNQKSPWLHNFHRIFDRNIIPKNISITLLKNINQHNSQEKNKHLYFKALNYLPKYQELDTDVKSKIVILAKQYNLNNELDLYKNPIKSGWEIKDEIREKELAIQNQIEIEKNETYFSKLSDTDISLNSNTLYKIATKLYITKHYQVPETNFLTVETFSRLKNILKDLIYNPLNTDLENLKSLAHSNTGTTRIRPIDLTYYVSCSLNHEFTKKIKNKKFCKYLYILCQCKKNLDNIIKGTFLEQIEYFEVDEVETLKEYYRFMLEEKLPSYSNIIENYIKHEKCKSQLINLSILNFTDNTTNANQILNAFIGSYNFKIEKQDLNKLIDFNDIDTTNKSIIKVLIAVRVNAKKIDIEDAKCFFSLFSFNEKYFDSFSQPHKLKLLDLFMSSIEKPQSMLDAHYDELGDFISRKGIYSLDIESIEKLYQKRKAIHDSWSDSILQLKDELKQEKSNKDHHQHSIQNLRDYLLKDSILDKKDFFTDVCLKIKAIKTEIEDNRNNEKKLFYRDDKNPKKENDCRDIVLSKLNDKYGKYILSTKEKEEANSTRVDINLKLISNLEYEVQVECKRNNNQQILKGIEDQLIGKYFTSGVQFGIYLVFYFGIKETKDVLYNKIIETIPDEYSDNIEVIFIDLT